MADKLKLEAAAAYVDDDFATSIELYTKVSRCRARFPTITE